MNNKNATVAQKGGNVNDCVTVSYISDQIFSNLLGFIPLLNKKQFISRYGYY
jgi:hypothetical protein